MTCLLALLLLSVSCGGNQPETTGGQEEDNGNSVQDTSGGDTGNPTNTTEPPGELVSMSDMAAGVRVWKNSGCTDCHRIGDDTGGERGPVLTDIGDRYTREELKAWIRNPQAVRADAAMPAQDLPEEDLKYLASYLSLLSSDTMPD